MGPTGSLHVVVLAGGVGTRLWPVSRRSQPKQFQALLSERTMLEETYARVLPLTSPDRVGGHRRGIRGIGSLAASGLTA